jgi:hypothetical protein
VLLKVVGDFGQLLAQGVQDPFTATPTIITVNTVVRGHRFDLLQVDVELSSEGSRGGRLTSRRHAHNAASSYTEMMDSIR